MSIPRELHDPWVAGGLALLAVLSLFVVLLYRSAPQTVEEARTRTWIAARPSAYAPRMAQAEERLRAAAAAQEAGRDSAALSAYVEAAEQGWEARDLAEDPDQTAAATELWARAMLAQAALLQQAGTGPGLRPDDNEILREALARVERVLTVPVNARVQTRAEEMRTALQRQLRPGPLEWLPQRR